MRGRRVADPYGLRASLAPVEFRISRRGASTSVAIERYDSRKGSLSLASGVIGRGVPARTRQRRRGARSSLGWRLRFRLAANRGGLRAVRR